MAILPTFEYDIFISYRHNDNLPSLDSGRQASNGWVADFTCRESSREKTRPARDDIFVDEF